MHLDPPLQMLFAAMSAGATDDQPAADDFAEIRRRANETMLLVRPALPADMEVTEHVIAVDDHDGDDGGSIRVRTYRPAGLVAPMPTVFFIHGGGWIQGNLDTAEVEIGSLPQLVPCFGVSVEYRLAPEHPFPVPLHDCIAAFEWMVANATTLGVDLTRIVVAGTSAGGNLAAALCLVARDRGLTMPILQLLDVPALDLSLGSDSVTSIGDGAGLTGEMFANYAQLYLGDSPDPTEPYASPLLAPDLSGLPPAVILVAEHDPVRDDGERYLVRLHQAGVPAASFRVLAQIHGGWVIPFTMTSRLVPDLRAAAVRRAFDGTLVP